jgi:uncharacterized protein YcfJ
MKSLFFVLLSVISFPVFAAGQYASFSLEGQVIGIQQRFQYDHTPRQECWTEQVPVQSSGNRSYGGAVLGGVTGGVVGNQFGKGKGKEAATALGAVIGAFAGDSISNDGHRAPSVQYRSEQHCRSVPQSRKIPDGYDVTVLFQDQEFVFQMPNNPGRGSIRLDFNGTMMPVPW